MVVPLKMLWAFLHVQASLYGSGYYGHAPFRHGLYEYYVLSSSGETAGDGVGCCAACNAHSCFLRLLGALQVLVPLSVTMCICLAVTLVTVAIRSSCSVHTVAVAVAGRLILFVMRTLSPVRMRYGHGFCVVRFSSFRLRPDAGSANPQFV
jgi:hypothetical protein